MKQAIHRRMYQPITALEIEIAIREEWDKTPQKWINEKILEQEHWVAALMERHGWATPN